MLQRCRGAEDPVSVLRPWMQTVVAVLTAPKGVEALYFMAAPLVIARSDLLLTGPSLLIRYFAELVALQVLPPPIELPTYPEEAYWHERFDNDPAHAWLRKLLKEAASNFGSTERPRKRSW